MNRKHLILILFVFMIMFFISAGGISAQETDIENMDTDQLKLLLQQIMEKLSEDLSVENSAQEPAEPLVPAAAPTAAARVFSIYENKKLIIEALPDYFFIPKENGRSDKNDETNTPSKTPVPNDYSCDPGCSWICPPPPFEYLSCGCYCG